jgi:hypothetical protein
MPEKPKMIEVNTSTTLTSVVSRILGDFAFMVVSDELNNVPTAPEWLQGTMSYRGPMQGALNCWCTRPFALELSANLLGLDPSDGDAVVQSQDALREFMNVLCGNLMTERYGAEAVFDLSIPAVQETLSSPMLSGVAEHDRCMVEVDDAPLIVEHRIDL